MAEPPDRLKAALAGRYTIERELGHGGMATVYLAEDRKHHRQVAVKVLRPEVVAALGPERFLREITVTAGLHHPHILPLLDSGDAAGQLYYVMPFVEGESLRERLNREKQLPLEEALQITREVADALSYAHSHDVLHRDIKPENILLESGHAVVADFGIARAITAASSERLTDTGIAVGTPAYMSPEQAAGDQGLDGRSDLYSLGCVLYEMLAGEPPFTGPTPQAIFAKRLAESVPRISVVRETVPVGVEAALATALARVQADRHATAGAFVAALAHPQPLEAPGGKMAAIGRPPPWVMWAVGAAAVVMIVALAVHQVLRPTPLNITISDIAPVTTEPGVELQPAISPDGREVAYVAGPIGAPHLVIRRTANVAGGGEARLADTSLLREWFPSWSSDGDFVRFLACRVTGCAWNETGSLGGAVRPVQLPPRARNQVVAWSFDGARVAFVVADTIFVTSAADTIPRRIAVNRAKTPGMHSLAWSPDGKVIAYVSGNSSWRTSGNLAPSTIWAVSAEGGEPKPVTTGDDLNVSPAWLDARHLLFVSNRDGPRGVYVVEVGSKGRRGESRAIPGVADAHSISYSISARKLTYARLTYRQNIWEYPLGRSHAIRITDGRPVTSGSQVIEMSDLSPNGRWLAFDSNRRGKKDLYKIPLLGGDAVPLTTLSGDEEDPRWSPDGREIAFHTAGLGVTGYAQIMVMPAEGGSPTALTNNRGVNSFPAWSPNGLVIAFHSDRTGAFRVWLLSRDSVGGAWHEAVQLTDFDCRWPEWAPDGSGVVCQAGDDLAFVSRQGRTVWRRPAAMFGLSVIGICRYSADGRVIYVTGRGLGRDRRSGVWATPASGGTPRLVIASDDPGLEVAFGGISISRGRLYLTVSQYESDIWVANLRW